MTKVEAAGAVMVFLVGIVMGIVVFNTTMARANRVVDAFMQGEYPTPR